MEKTWDFLQDTVPIFTHPDEGLPEVKPQIGDRAGRRASSCNDGESKGLSYATVTHTQTHEHRKAHSYVHIHSRKHTSQLHTLLAHVIEWVNYINHPLDCVHLVLNYKLINLSAGCLINYVLCVHVYVQQYSIYICMYVCVWMRVSISLLPCLCCIHNSTSMEHDNEYFIVLQELALINDSILLWHYLPSYLCNIHSVACRFMKKNLRLRSLSCHPAEYPHFGPPVTCCAFSCCF